MSKQSPKLGALRVWWIPQVPGKPFHVAVASPAEAKKVLDILGKYDLFQFKNNIKGDYCNVGGLEVFEEMDDGLDWFEWHDEETDDDIDAFKATS